MQKIKTTYPLIALSKIYNIDYGDIIDWFWFLKQINDVHPRCPGWIHTHFRNIIWEHRFMSEGRQPWVDGYTLYV